MEKKMKHLEMIQGVINRMANNSFLLKGWSVTIVAGLLALSVATGEKIALICIALIPIVVFWILDGYFLWMERLFREVYKHVSKKEESEIDFDMNFKDFIKGRNRWIPTIFSNTLVIFYLSLLVTLGIVTLFLVLNKPIPPI
jgi:hypothetical protein